ncbi:PACE efflux transporter [Pseudomonas sp. D1-2]|uniref:PACE efflux transporter n=1 Tax=unclassified Pseudomonas TaxID=196821 RepID=UPI003DA9F440
MAPTLALTYEQGMGYSTLLSLVISAVALAWNMLFNGLFEEWERRQPSRHRNWQRRLLHSLGFEGGLTLILTPVIGAWLGISLWFKVTRVNQTQYVANACPTEHRRANASFFKLFANIGHHRPSSLHRCLEYFFSHPELIRPVLQLPSFGNVDAVPVLRPAVAQVICHCRVPYVRPGIARRHGVDNWEALSAQ